MKKRKNAAAVQLGRLGGLARAASQTKAERRAQALKAIRARWRKAKGAKKQ